jgi:hypothetical protein
MDMDKNGWRRRVGFVGQERGCIAYWCGIVEEAWMKLCSN